MTSYRRFECSEFSQSFCLILSLEKVELLTKFLVILIVLIPYDLQLLNFGMTLISFDVTAIRKQNNFEFGIKDK